MAALLSATGTGRAGGHGVLGVRRAEVFGGLLVGGRGQRLGGVDKSSLPLPSGPTLGEHIVEVLRSRVEVVRVAARLDQAVTLAHVDVVRDVVSGAGPLAGLVALLENAPAPWLWLVACDLPHLRGEVLDALWEKVQPGVQVVVPAAGGHEHYTCALYHQRVLERAREHLQAGRLSLRGLVAAVPHAMVEVPEALGRALVNINTVEDLISI